jgi:hypothetical protein
MTNAITSVNSIQEEWCGLVNEWLREEERAILTSRSPMDIQDTILEWFTKPTIYMPRGTGALTSFEYRFNSLLNSINDFWRRRGSELLSAINELEVYSLELPVYNLYTTGTGIIRRLGVYFDTILITDPIHLNDTDLHSLSIPHGQSTSRKVAIVQNLALVLQLNPLRSVNVDQPLFLVVPDMSIGNPIRDTDLATEFLSQKVFQDRLKIASPLEMFAALASDTIDLKANYVDQTVLNQLFSFFRYDPEGIGHLIRRDTQSSEVREFSPHASSAGTLHWLLTKIYESFDVYSRSLMNGLSFGSDPVVPMGYWQLYEWLCAKIAPAGSIFSPSRAEEVVAAQGLLREEMKFLEAVSLEGLRRIREEGDFSQLRKTLRVEREDLKNATPTSFDSLSKSFSSNLIETVHQFSVSLKETSKKSVKERIRHAASFGLSIGLTALPFLFPTSALLSILSTGAGVIWGGSSAVDIVKSFKQSRRDRANMISSPLGILYTAYEHSQHS